uniref:Uncharacterized protein n=1 Tax=Glossina austeni TaxID=7395 RepID=A0A1A9UIC6_GLOAU
MTVTAIIDTGTSGRFVFVFCVCVLCEANTITVAANIQVADGTRLCAGSPFLCPMQLCSLTTLIKFIVMPQDTEEVIRGYNVLQELGTAIPRPAALEELDEFQNQLQHNLYNTSRLISGLIFESNSYEKSVIPGSSTNTMNISTDHMTNRNRNEYISQEGNRVIDQYKSVDNHIMKESPRKAEMGCRQQL